MYHFCPSSLILSFSSNRNDEDNLTQYIRLTYMTLTLIRKVNKWPPLMYLWPTDVDQNGSWMVKIKWLNLRTESS